MTRRRTRAGFGVALLVAGLTATIAAALPPGVIALHGKTSQALNIGFTFNPAAHSINGFGVDYTCRGKVPKTDSDVYSIESDGTDAKALAKLKATGKIDTIIRGHVTRFTEDGPATRGPGELVLHARLKARPYGRRSFSGTVRIVSVACPSKVAAFTATDDR